MFPPMKIMDPVIYYRLGDYDEEPATGHVRAVGKNGKLTIVVWVGTEMKQYKNRRHKSHPELKSNPTMLRNEGCWLTVDEFLVEDENRKLMPLHTAGWMPDEIAKKLGWTIDQVLDAYNRIEKKPNVTSKKKKDALSVS